MRIVVILVLALASAACSPAAMPLPVGHPARADATPGRLADPPAALRRGATEHLEPAEPTPPVDHSKHEGHQ
jgi:hypothetical protein